MCPHSKGLLHHIWLLVNLNYLNLKIPAAYNNSFRGVSRISAPYTPSTTAHMCSGIAPGGYWMVEDEEGGCVRWADSFSSSSLPFPLSDLSGRQPGSNVEMWLAGVDLIKSAHVSLQRGDPRLNHPEP